MGSVGAALGGFSLRQRAVEGQWFNTEGQLAVMRHLEKMVQQGKVDAAVLESVRRGAEATALSGVPTEVINQRSEYVYQHKKGMVPAPRFNDRRYMQMGTQISMGRARWTSDSASIFSVADGKRLASTPPPAATYSESIRAMKIRTAAMETPTLAGFRLLPELTPGRAMMWGAILAAWGTAAVVATAARQLDIRSAEEAPARLRQLFAPLSAALTEGLAPLKARMAIGEVAGDALRQDAQRSLVVRRLRASFD